MTHRHISAETLLPEVQSTRNRIITRKMKATQGISRLTLGEISNRVTAITIDASKKQTLQKEIPQLSEKIVAQTRTAKTRVPCAITAKSSNITTRNKHIPDIKAPSKTVKAEVPKQNHAPAKVECLPAEPPLPSASKVACEVILESPNVSSMDVSGAGKDAFSKAFFLEQIEDIDIGDKADPQLVSIYVKSIYSYMRQLEKKYSIKPGILDGTDITGKMRALLIDWLCQVHHKFHLLQETFFLTVSIIDRYLQAKPCRRSKLQLVGVTAMLVASKYEEMYAPEVADFVYITDNAYTKQDVRDMEQDILRTLDFSIGRPNCLHFLRRNSKAAQVSALGHMLAKYFMELAVIEYEMVHLPPSHLAAAALCLAMHIVDGSIWSPSLEFYSSYSLDELMPLVCCLAQLAVKAETSKLTAVKTKHSSSKYMKVALIPQLKSKALLDLAAASSTKMPAY